MAVSRLNYIAVSSQRSVWICRQMGTLIKIFNDGAWFIMEGMKSDFYFPVWIIEFMSTTEEINESHLKN